MAHGNDSPIYRNIPLDNGKNEIRLITVLPEADDRLVIECTMESLSMQDWTNDYQDFMLQNRQISDHRKLLPDWYMRRARPDNSAVISENSLPKFPSNEHHRFKWGDFAALSYTWGDPTQTRTIKVNAHEMNVTMNLGLALEVIRDMGEFSSKFRLWIDALCIHQVDAEERNVQVGKMRDIYSTSWSVVGFLGPEGDGSDKAINLLEVIAECFNDKEKCEAMRDLLEKEPRYFERGSWLALNKFTLRPYWERLWIVQEVALGGERTTMFCGSRRIDWTILCHGIEVIFKYLWLVKDTCASLDWKYRDPPGGRSWENTGPLHHIWKDLWTLGQLRNLESEPLSLSRLLEVSTFTTCSDGRDKVYGLLGLMDRQYANAIKPDYGLRAQEAFIEAAKAYISVYNNLELLREANTWGMTGLPTWVPDWTWMGRMRDTRPGVQHNVAQENPGYKNPHASELGYKADYGLSFQRVRFKGTISFAKEFSLTK